MRKKFWVCLLSAFMLLPVLGGVTACNGGNDSSTYNITVWVGEGTDTLTKQQIQRFNETNEFGVKFNATVEIVSESKAMGNAISTPASCADIFCVAPDTLARGVHSKLLQTLSSSSVDAIKANCDEGSVQAATIGNTVRAFPITADNAFFALYDRSVVPDEDAGSLEKMIEDCENAGRNFSMNSTGEGGSWYAASFFYATGCRSEWTTDENGNFTAYDDTFNSDEGVIALQGMQKLMQSSCYHASAEVADFNAKIKSAVVISGIWGYKAAKEALGDNLGIAPLPAFEVDGQSYQLVSYLGRKLMCVKPQSDPYRASYLQKLALFLTSKECQLERFNAVGWGPADKEAAKLAESEALTVLANAKTTLQGQYPTTWWSTLDITVGSAKDSTSDADTLRGLLEDYAGQLNGLMKADNAAE